jgi:hypothetical protein
VGRKEDIQQGMKIVLVCSLSNLFYVEQYLVSNSI